MVAIPHNFNLYPELDSFNNDWLRADETHQVYYEECGNPKGVPVIFLHGGPGSGCNPAQRRFFDPSHYRIILMDQRGCGRSTPLGGTAHNTTQDLVNDIEALRKHLRIEKWHVFGGSWGSTLALCYATQFKEHVLSLILRGIFLSRPSELSWFLGDIQHFYPDVWQNLLNFLPVDEQDKVLDAYKRRIFSDDPNVSQPAAICWNAYESAIMRLLPNNSKSQKSDGEEKESANRLEVARARIQIHYIQQHCFIDGEAILKEASKLNAIPTVIVQGRYDMVCPPQTAWELSKAMPHAKLVMVPDAGHSAMEAGVISALVEATELAKSITE